MTRREMDTLGETERKRGTYLAEEWKEKKETKSERMRERERVRERGRE